MQTARAGLGSVSRLDKYDLNPSLLSLVDNHRLQLGKTPFVDEFRFPGFPNPPQVFKDDPLLAGFRISNDLLAETVIGVRHKTSFSTRDTRERAFGASAAVGLKRLARSFVTSFFMANLFRALKLFARCDRDSIDAQINTQTPRRLFNLWCGNRQRDVQVEIAFPVDQFGGTRFTLAKALAHPGRHLQLTRDATFRTNGQRRRVAVWAENHCPGVESQGRVRLKLMEFVRLACVSRADLSNRIDHMLSRKTRFRSDQVIARVMDIEFTMQALLEGELGKSVARAIGLFHRGFKFLSDLSSDNQFGLDGDVNIHASRLYAKFAVRQAQIAYRRSQNSSPLKLTKMFAMGGVSF